jgi:hypothetical protein
LFTTLALANLVEEQFKELAARIWTANMPNYLKPKLINLVKGWPLDEIDFVRASRPRQL